MQGVVQDRLFISYASRDGEQVRSVVDYLQQSGLSVWFDQSGIGAGDLIVDQIDTGLSTAKYFILFWSRTYASGYWTRAEARAAFHLAMQAGERRIVVVRMDEAEVPPLLTASRHIVWNDAAAVAADIAKTVTRGDLTLPEATIPPLPSQQKLDWAEVQDALLPSLAKGLLAATGALLAQRRPVVIFDAPIGSQRVLRLAVMVAMLENDRIRADLEADIEILQNKERFASELRKMMASEHLGTLQPAVIIALEKRQTEIQELRGRIRNALASLTEGLAVVQTSVN
jgi:hypothetical protein